MSKTPKSAAAAFDQVSGAIIDCFDCFADRKAPATFRAVVGSSTAHLQRTEQRHDDGAPHLPRGGCLSRHGPCLRLANL
jgi:hypothetical protein